MIDRTRASSDVLVIGAGIVGLATALKLQMQGRRVDLVDPNPPASGCSAGNAGHITLNRYASIAPPDVLWRLPKMLLDPLGPLVIRPSHLPRLLPWAIRLIRALRPPASALTTAGLTAMNRLAMPSYAPLLKAADATDLFEIRGSLFVYMSGEAFTTAARGIADLRANEVSVDVLDRNEVLELEPALSRRIVGGLLFPQCGRCASPEQLGQRFAEVIARNGGLFHRTTARRIVPTEQNGWTVHTDAGPLTASQLIVSAGRWSDSLLEPLGYSVPLESERGYHLMLPSPGVQLSRPTAMAERGFIATPMRDGLRLAGTVEFAALDTPMDPRRSDILCELAQPYLPGLDKTGATRWMGNRPVLPDSLPAIGAASRHRNLLYNFGHHHLGLTYAAASAQILSSVIVGESPPIDVSLMSLDRFSRFRPQRTIGPSTLQGAPSQIKLRHVS